MECYIKYIVLIVWLIVVWLLLWNWVKFETFESWMRGNEMTFPNFHLAFMISTNSNSFHHKTLEWRWYDFFHLNKWKGFEFHLELFQIRKLLCSSIIFMREDKMTSSNRMKYELEVSKNQIESPFEVILKPTFNLELFGFYSNYFSPKLK